MSKVVKSIKKVVKKKIKSAKKALKSVGKAFSKFFSSTFGKVVLAAVAVFTMGAALGAWGGLGAAGAGGAGAGSAAAGAGTAAAGSSAASIAGAGAGAVGGVGGGIGAAAGGAAATNAAAGAATGAATGSGLGVAAKSAGAAASAGGLLTDTASATVQQAAPTVAQTGIDAAQLGGGAALPTTGIEGAVGDGAATVLDAGQTVGSDVINGDLASQMLDTGAGSLSPEAVGGVDGGIFGSTVEEQLTRDFVTNGAQGGSKGLIGRVMEAGKGLNNWAKENKLLAAMGVNALANAFTPSQAELQREAEKREARRTRAAYDGIDEIGSPLEGRRIGELRRTNGERVYNDRGGIIRDRMRA